MDKCKLIFVAILFSASIITCKKGNTPEFEAPSSPTNGTRTQFTLDSIYLYSKQVYLWNEALPGYTTFNPRGYIAASTDMQNFKQALYVLSQYKINTNTSLPYEKGLLPGAPKYSFITQNTSINGFEATVDTEGKGNDFGLSVAFSGEQAYIRMVDEGSSAALTGIKRGDQILLVNDLPVNEDELMTSLGNASLKLKLQNAEQEVKTVTVQKTIYTSNPVMNTTVLKVKNETLGYFALSRFTQLSNSKKGLDDAFSVFATSGISTLVLDLRYNNGGYVETARYLANLIASAALNGKVMCIEHYNDQMQQGKATILKNQLYFDKDNKPVYLNGRRATYADVDFSVSGNTYYFKKEGNLETIKNIYFIVSGETASASEVLINSLKPYFNVKLVGNQTYGKPVGFFSINIDKYQLYIASFLIRNALNAGDYFNGFVADVVVNDDVTRDFGDQHEQCFSTVLNDLNPCLLNDSRGNIQKRNINSAPLKNISWKKELPGMIKEQLKLIKTE